ncbi:2-amino-4-hydroxy-6-hydroxymethyldihydropteridine diphosphokinase [Elongatibacter sediminis]|uniref:2-amino-4-hydroxy-6-hydroxymethyldihydropteridine pyrophosphokinase n=1 Tax=Elongatibacter sediminis TaxID=3119006 RepID=A0AAW9RKR7_9GAMM
MTSLKQPVTVYLGIGSNVDAERNVEDGIAALREAFGAVTVSPVYRSVAVGFEGADFLNLAVAVNTALPPLALKHWLNTLERRHGRRRDVPKFSDRTLDIDILLYADLWLISPELELPRREILQHAHVLRPLADLAPDALHPVAGVSVGQLWADFTGDRSGLQPTAFSP